MRKIVALSSLIFWILIPSPAVAQITPDSSLGAENSVVETNGNRDTINGGAIRDANLFHSFQEFNVEALRSAYFTNPDGIANIFSRVTGNNISDIQGVLGVLGDANLYLINPNGILFGENARLDVNGSFFATTADSVLFDNGFEFSTANPDAPPLLTIDIPIGLRFRDNPAPITNRSFVRNVADTDFVGLEVPTGANLTLVGGDINFEGGEATVPGGRVDLGGLSESGIVTINDNGSLTFPEGIARANVTFTTFADVDVRGAGGGSITINARNIELDGELGSTSLRAGIAPDSGSLNAQAGDITLNAVDTISVSQGSGIFNQVAESGVGNAGRINITTTNLFLTQGGRVSASTFGQGDSGGINITTTDLFLTQGGVVNASTFGPGDAGAITINASGTISVDGESSGGIINRVTESGIGNAGGINITTTDLFLTQGGIVSAGTSGQGDSGEIKITTTNLFLTQGSVVNAITSGQGDAGTITINASGTISVDGESSGGLNSGIFSVVESTGEGNAGGIKITTTDLFLTQGGFVDASTFGQGDAGAITIKASGTISAEGERSDGLLSSGIFSTVASTEEIKAGGIKITTTDLFLTQGGLIDASTFGQGDAGAITINASGTISAKGENSDGISSGIFSTVGSTGEGNGGGIKITTTDLSLTQGGKVSASTFGQGDAGAITINASGTISADAEKNPDGVNSGIFSAVSLTTAEGNAGEINITTTDLSLTQGSTVSTSTVGPGDAGVIKINASGTISLDGGRIFSRVESTAEGNSGGIKITTTDLSLTQGGELTASTFGQGDAGAITINASGTISADGESSDGVKSGIFSTVESTAEGNSRGIKITTTDLSLTQGGTVSANTVGQGDAGAITINASGIISADAENPDGVNSGIFSTVALTAEGNAGGIKITTTDLSLTQGGQVNASTFGFGKAGAITINASGTISADGEDSEGFVSGIFSTVQGVGNSEGIKITTTDLSLTQGGIVSANTFGFGNAGAITINASSTISADGESQAGFNSGIVSTVQGVGNSEGIKITTTDLSLTQGGVVSASTFGFGNAGAITINASGTISADGESQAGSNSSGIFSAAGEDGEGNAREVNINTNNLSLTNNAQISVQSLGQGNAGNLDIQANSLALENGASLLASTPVDTGGSIFLTIAENLTLRENSTISARATNNANGGNVNIDARFIVAFPNQNNDIIASASQGQGGEINITTEGIFGLEERSSTPTNQTNDIDASSEFGLSGEVTITRPDVDPTRGLLELTQDVVDPAKLIAQNVCTQTADSEFVDIGKGGLPQNPQDRLAEDFIEVGLVAPIITSSETTEPARERIAIKPSHTRKPPAQGWIFHDNGIVELVAYNPNQVGEQRTWDNHRGCQE